ncbi:hypothetical protein jhhlp_001875 [Lomentospora prolificans]|uniref:DNA-directed RNA polymerase II subunit RPB9 n=1 Tax=Lomentospora prolificans TaxID=41688 RepID=A0A2N3NCF2_9PEZI|nr:hypothetical protein jhhlp_001875 [Lomentospora prolificans]
MATPASTTSDSEKKNLEQISFRFCSECSNMLYPKEDPENRRLLFTCRTCQYTEEAQSSCVFRNIMNNAAGETAGVTQDVGSDPTVSPLENTLCLMCGRPVLCGPHVVEEAGDDAEDIDDIDDTHGALLADSVYLLEDLVLEDDEPDDWEPDTTGSTTEDTKQGETRMTKAEMDLPRATKSCPSCRHDEAVFFQSQQRSAETGMKLFYVCCECGHIFQ